MKVLLAKILETLHDVLSISNEERRASGALTLPKQKMRIVGQTALLLNDLPFFVAATADIDLVGRLNFEVAKELSDILIQEGLSLDSDGHLIWMPPKTRYLPFLELPLLSVSFAHHHDVMLAKVRFNRQKDRRLIEIYETFFPDFKNRRFT